MANEIHVGDIGTRFIVILMDAGEPVDISTATSMSIFLKGKGAASEKTAALLSGGVDGKMYYDALDGDLNCAGDWKIQAEVQTPAGTWKSSIKTFTVYPNL